MITLSVDTPHGGVAHTLPDSHVSAATAARFWDACNETARQMLPSATEARIRIGGSETWETLSDYQTHLLVSRWAEYAAEDEAAETDD